MLQKWRTRLLWMAVGVLVAGPLYIAGQAITADISASSWSETDASNNSTPPDGAPEGMAPSATNNVIRMIMGAIKRTWDRSNASVTSSGSSGVYALSYSVAPTTYTNGETFSFRANHTNGSTGASLNISSLGAKSLVKPSTNGLIALAASDIATANHVVVQYDSTADQFVVVSGLPNSSTGGTVTSVATGTGLTGGPITSSGTVSLSINTLTTLAAPATNDSLAIYDTSASAHRGITLQDFLSVVNALTEETNVQAATDYVLLYDVSASAARKVKPSNLGASTNDRLLYQYAVSSGTGGPTYTSGGWRTVSINTEAQDTASIGSVASNQVTLAAGSYDFTGVITLARAGTLTARMRIQNITDGTTVAQGNNNATLDATTGENFNLHVTGSTVITGTKVFELQVYMNDNSAAPAAVSSGDNEIYTSFWIRRYAS